MTVMTFCARILPLYCFLNKNIKLIQKRYNNFSKHFFAITMCKTTINLIRMTLKNKFICCGSLKSKVKLIKVLVRTWDLKKKCSSGSLKHSWFLQFARCFPCTRKKGGQGTRIGQAFLGNPEFSAMICLKGTKKSKNSN